MKTAVVCSRVPAVLSPTGEAMQIGEKIGYKKVVFRNGETHLVLNGKKQVPACFFHLEFDEDETYKGADYGTSRS